MAERMCHACLQMLHATFYCTLHLYLLPDAEAEAYDTELQDVYMIAWCTHLKA